jgi:hypothetical protein
MRVTVEKAGSVGRKEYKFTSKKENCYEPVAIHSTVLVVFVGDHRL